MIPSSEFLNLELISRKR